MKEIDLEKLIEDLYCYINPNILYPAINLALEKQGCKLDKTGKHIVEI